MLTVIHTLGGGTPFRPWLETDNVWYYDIRYGIVTYSGGSLVLTWDDRNPARSQQLAQAAGKSGAGYFSDDGDGIPAARFDAATNLMTRASFTPLDLDADFTFAMVAYLDAARTADIYWSFGAYPNPGFFAHYNPSAAHLGVGLENNTGMPVSGAVSFATGWHFVWGRRSGSSFYCGVDGTESSAGTAPGGSFAANELFFGGYRANGTAFCTGKWRLRAHAAWNTDIGTTRLAKLRTWLKTQWPSLP